MSLLAPSISTEGLVQVARPRAETPRTSRRPVVPRGAHRYLGVVVVLAIWQVASSTGLLNPQDLAGPFSVVRAGWDLTTSGVLPGAVWVSLQRVLVGLALGVSAGLLLAVGAGLSHIGESLIDAPVQMLRFLPIIGLQPLVVLWFGIGDVAKISLIVLGVMFPIYINTSAAIRDIDPRHLELARTVGLRRAALLRRIVVPAALPAFLVGLRYAAAAAWLILVFAEQLNATNGIGYLIIKSETFFQTNVIVVALGVYALLGLATDSLIRFVERKALAWQPSR